MKKTIYMEPSIISILTARETFDPNKRPMQLATRNWYDNHSHEYTIVVSDLTLEEIKRGDPVAARKRREEDLLPKEEL